MVLIDTCIVIDWLYGKLQNTNFVAHVMEEGAVVSAISVFEMAIKASQGKLDVPSDDIAGDIRAQGFALLNLTPAHANGLLRLPYHHRDPFDRLLIVQAQQESLQIATYDRVFTQYLPETLVL